MNFKPVHTFVAVFALFCAWCSPAAAQQVVVEYDTALLASPRGDAKVVAQLKKGTNAELLSRQGAWVNLKTASGTGWVNAFNVREPAAPGAARAPRPAARATTATIGIRGLEAEDLKSASFNAQQIGVLERYAVSKADAERAARATGLEPARVEYFNP